ncbi:MAG: AAA-like domain-containing protein, partial [Verrucomicrobiae bacterium]|nr:AAA-like domain-containing protein [Verrucomicrobiae bacterium]
MKPLLHFAVLSSMGFGWIVPGFALDPAKAPPHLSLARDLLAAIVPERNLYDASPTAIVWPDEATPNRPASNRSVCSSFGAAALRKAYGISKTETVGLFGEIVPEADDFFAAIRFVFNARATDARYERLTFVLLGVAIPADLIKDRSRTPFNIGQGIDLTDFSREDARVLQEGLQRDYPEQGDDIFDRIFYWTHGHPYLTQKLCLSVTERGNGDTPWSAEVLDQLVDELFLSKEARKETNLQFVRDYVRNSPHKQRLMGLYQQVHSGKAVAEDERSLYQNQLKLFGLVKVEKNSLAVRNEIYRRVFNAEWIAANTPVDWTRRIAIAAILVVLLLVGVIGFTQWQGQQAIADQAQTQIDNFRSTTSADVRLTSLAGLYDLPGFADQANRLFFDDLSREERLALFTSADPTAVGGQLITVIRALYTRLENNERDNTLLQTMVAPLEAVNDVRAGTLATEIKQWLQG